MSKLKTRDTSTQSFKVLDPQTAAKKHAKLTYVKTKQAVAQDINNKEQTNQSDMPTNDAISTVADKSKMVSKNANEAGRKAFIRTKQSVKLRAKGINPISGKQTKAASFKKGQYTLYQKNGLKKTEKQARKNIQQARNIKRTQSAFKRAAQTASRVIKLAIASTKALISAILAGGWVAILVIIICCLFGVAFYFFGDESSSNYTPVSPEVESYDSVIRQYAKEYGMSEYVELIKAVMMQESAGKGTEPMQASECAYNTKYPHVANSIKDANYSIACGIQQLMDCLDKSKTETPVDMEHIRLALQGYNFGVAYIDWAIKEDGGYTVANASKYSDDMAKKTGTSSYGDKQYPAHVLRYYPYGSYNFGIGNTIITQIASQQVGNKGGEKYWSWYGFDSHVEWCACFVSWCADQGGYIKSGTIPKFALVSDGVNWFKSKGQWQKKSYTPAAGDIIFFDWEGDGSPDHVGIVEKCENGLVYTIEENSVDECKRKSYTVGGAFIFGYAVPKY